MTKTDAIDLVFDLISAVRDFEQRSGDKYYRAQYEEAREAVIAALTHADGKTPDA